jgi:predicted RNase H-like HicB family nuclease
VRLATHLRRWEALARRLRRSDAYPHHTHEDEPLGHLTLRLQPDTLDGGVIAECVELPGCMSHGETEREAIENVIEAITGVLNVRLRRGVQSRTHPVLTGDEPGDRRLLLSV